MYSYCRNTHSGQSYTGLPKRAQDLKQMIFCNILANFFLQILEKYAYLGAPVLWVQF